MTIFQVSGTKADHILCVRWLLLLLLRFFDYYLQKSIRRHSAILHAKANRRCYHHGNDNIKQQQQQRPAVSFVCELFLDEPAACLNPFATTDGLWSNNTPKRGRGHDLKISIVSSSCCQPKGAVLGSFIVFVHIINTTLIHSSYKTDSRFISLTEQLSTISICPSFTKLHRCCGCHSNGPVQLSVKQSVMVEGYTFVLRFFGHFCCLAGCH